MDRGQRTEESSGALRALATAFLVAVEAAGVSNGGGCSSSTMVSPRCEMGDEN